jgi:hypothetical protein
MEQYKRETDFACFDDKAGAFTSHKRGAYRTKMVGNPTKHEHSVKIFTPRLTARQF